nr:LOW QUALITY PROTEIN: ankyrin-3-like [Cherax quadricarinatus]
MLPLSSVIRRGLPTALQKTFLNGEDVATRLARAFVACDEGLVQACLDEGVDPNLSLARGHTPLTLLLSTATSDRWENLVRLLLEAGASPHTRDPRGTPLLSLLVIAGSSDLVGLALDKGADVNVCGPDGETPLLAAVHYRKVESLRLLLQRGADPNTTSCDGNTALMWAAGRSNGIGMQMSLACVKMLLKHGALVNFRNPRGYTPLMAASLIRERETVKSLLAAGADPDQTDEKGETALMKAADADDEGVIAELLAGKASVNIQSRTGCTALMSAVSTEVMTRLLQHHSEPTLAAKDGNTPLHHQAMSDRPELAYLLLEYGAHLEARNGQGNTPLQTAVRCKSYAVTNLLLDTGANALAINDKGVSVLHDAVLPWDYYNTHDIFTALNTPTLIAELLHYFRCRSDMTLTIAERLLRLGANPGLRGEHGVTPLMLAAACGNERLLRLLIHYGATAASRDTQGRTALAYACKWGHAHLGKLSHSLMIFPVNTLDQKNNLPIYYAAQPHTPLYFLA